MLTETTTRIRARRSTNSPEVQLQDPAKHGRIPRQHHPQPAITPSRETRLKIFRAGIFLLAGIKLPVPGIRALHVERLAVDSRHPLSLALGGELDGTLPGEFEAVAEALRVITPPRS